MFFPIGDENHTIRTPVATYALLVALALIWIFVQGAGFDPVRLATTVCNYGMVAGEITAKARVGAAVPIGNGLMCVVDREPINVLTPLTSMFLHGSWGHLLGNCLFFWVFGNNVEDSMGRLRFLLFYVMCGLAAAAAQIAISAASPVPMVGASGAIAGVLGGYLVLYPRANVRVLVFLFIFIQVVRVPAYVVLLLWIGYQVITGLPELTMRSEVNSGVAVWAHIGGFVAGVVLVKLFARKAFVDQHRAGRARRISTAWGR
jgi:membrane associated rhomboid family serine protease